MDYGPIDQGLILLVLISTFLPVSGLRGYSLVQHFIYRNYSVNALSSECIRMLNRHSNQCAKTNEENQRTDSSYQGNIIEAFLGDGFCRIISLVLQFC